MFLSRGYRQELKVFALGWLTLNTLRGYTFSRGLHTNLLRSRKKQFRLSGCHKWRSEVDTTVSYTKSAVPWGRQQSSRGRPSIFSTQRRDNRRLGLSGF